MRLSSKILILAVLAFLLCLVPGQTHSEPVSRDVEIILLPGFFEQTYTESLNLIEESDKKSRSPVAGAKRIAQVEVNDVVTDVNKIAPGKKVVIDLFDDYRVTATVEQVDACINQVTTTRSRIDETQYGYMVTSALGTRVLAVIEIPEHNKQYRIIFDSVLQEHFMYEYDLDHIDKLDSAPSLKPPGKGYTGDTEGKIFATEFHFQPEGSSDYLELYSGSETAIVDVLVVYTPAAADWAANNVGSIDLVIDQAMSRAQLTLDNSDTLVNMRLVHSGLIDYLEYAGDPIYYPEYNVTASGIYVDLARLTQGTDGFELAHQWRDLYGADLVALFNLSDDIYGGVAWQLYDENGDSDYAFSLTSVSEASWTYTHIHEMGHNMGAGHHKMQNEEPGPGLFSYSAGWRWIGNDDGRYCSVMTYENGGYYADGQTHLEVAHFSNPAISHQGVSTGHAVDGDNARTIREVRNIIAGYRPDAGIPGNFEANAVSMNQIDLSWQQNADGHSVMVVWAPDDVFGTPADGTAYSAGQVLPGGGTVLYSGSNTSYSHLGLEEDTRYYYKAFSYDASNIYTPGAVAFADTFSEAITVYPWTETFEDDSLTRSKWYQAFISGNTGWTLGTGSLGASDYGDGSITTAHDGALNARFTGDSYSNDITRLITPLLDISNLNEPRLTFWYGQERWYEPEPDGWDDQNELRVYYRTTPVSAWVEIFHDDQNRPQWTEKILNLPNPSTTYQIAFEGICNYGFANVLDSVTVSDTFHAQGPEPNFAAVPTEGDAPLEVQFTDQTTGNPTGWAWYFGDENYVKPWNFTTAAAQWPERSGHSVVVLNDGSIVLMGGTGSMRLNDVWRSVDQGLTWVQMTANAGWPARERFSSVALSDGSIVIMGGSDGSTFFRDVWRSTDQGATWNEMTSSAEWLARWGHSSVALSDDSIVLMGGHTGSWKNDIWRSTDQGETWDLLVNNAQWPVRVGHTSVVQHDGSLLIMGGSSFSNARNDVWHSSDGGVNWNQLTSSAAWDGRFYHSAVVIPDGSVVITGGHDGYNQKNDAWLSSDQGNTWLQLTGDAEWGLRSEHSSVVTPDGTLLLLGGNKSGSNKANDVWQLETASSYEQNPVYTYSNDGIYNVSLQAYNSNGYSSIIKAGYVSVGNNLDPVDISDSNLEDAIRDGLNKPTGDITVYDMETLLTLDAANRGIVDLTGLEYAVNLIELNLEKNYSIFTGGISDLSALSGLDNLEYLNLGSQGLITDLQPLSGLVNLKYLNLSGRIPVGKISDISPLSALTNLQTLDLSNNWVNDLSSLSNLYNLQNLFLNGNSIHDISSLADINSLERLNLNRNGISDISPLSGMANLEYLYLGSNQIDDVTSLAGLVNLLDLELYNNQIKSLTPLTGLVNLRKLNLGMGYYYIGQEGNLVNDISPLAGLTDLEELGLYNNEIKDISPLSGLLNLQVLHLGDNQIGDISVLSELANLKMLYLESNQISDLSSTTALVDLEMLFLVDNRITCINALSSLTQLGDLNLEYNYININPGSSAMAVIENLKIEGVNVSYEPQKEIGDYDFSISLAEGWNLVSIPRWVKLVVLDDDSVEGLLTYKQGKWQNGVISDLQSPARAVFIKVTQPVDINYVWEELKPGNEFAEQLLSPGWNLISSGLQADYLTILAGLHDEGDGGLTQIFAPNSYNGNKQEGYHLPWESPLIGLLHPGEDIQADMSPFDGYWVFLRGEALEFSTPVGSEGY